MIGDRGGSLAPTMAGQHFHRYGIVGRNRAIAVLDFNLWLGPGKQAAAAPGAAPTGPTVLAAGPGRVEPISEEISVSAQISGKAVLIEEGDRVPSGQRSETVWVVV